jgi:hypothetical protein
MQHSGQGLQIQPGAGEPAALVVVERTRQHRHVKQGVKAHQRRIAQPLFEIKQHLCSGRALALLLNTDAMNEDVVFVHPGVRTLQHGLETVSRRDARRRVRVHLQAHRGNGQQAVVAQVQAGGFHIDHHPALGRSVVRRSRLGAPQALPPAHLR